MDYKEILKRLRNVILFGGSYLFIFFLIEARKVPINIIRTEFDEIIPFCEYFIVPYVIWYLYVAATLVYLGLNKHKTKEYYGFIANMALGMIVFVIISIFYPNGQNLRPQIAVDNIFTWAVDFLYQIDTSTNILPSLHVFASVACDIALCRDPEFKKHSLWQWASHLLSFLIVLSTMFLKQHSVIDVIAAFICIAVFYPVVYYGDVIWAYVTKRHRKTQYRKKLSS